MTDDEITDEEDEDTEYDDSALGRTVKNLRKELRKAQKDLRDAQEGSKRAEAAERKIAILEAKLDLEPDQVKALAAVHEGDWTAEGVRATAERLKFVSAAKDSGVSDEESGSLQRMAEATAGATPPNSESREQKILNELDPRSLSEEEFWAKADALGVTSNSQ